MTTHVRAYPSKEHLRFLDDLRQSGIVNMFGAAPWLEAKFGLSTADARVVLAVWMETYAERHPIGRRSVAGGAR